MTNAALPRGIWFEPERNRFRIRKYRNGRTFIRYRDTLDEAFEVLNDINKTIATIPKLPRGTRRIGAVPVSTFAGLAKVARQEKY